MRFMSNPPLAEEDQTGIVTGQSTPHCSGNPDNPHVEAMKDTRGGRLGRGKIDWVKQTIKPIIQAFQLTELKE